MVVDHKTIFRSASLISIMLASLMLLNFIFWSTSSSAFDRGYQLAEAELKQPAVESSMSFSIHGPRTYEGLAEAYSYLAFWALGLIAVGAVRIFVKIPYIAVALSILNAACLLPLILLLRYQIGFKDIGQDPYLNTPYNTLAIQSFTYDWIALLICYFLLLLEVVLFLAWLKTRKTGFSGDVA